MGFNRNGAAFALLLCLVGPATSAAQQSRQSSDLILRTTKAAAPSQTALIGLDDGLSVIGAALESRSQRSRKLDCSHLVHDIYERAGFSYTYVNSSDLYDGSRDFRRVTHPQPGDLVVWPFHVGIVISPAKHTFYSALHSGLGIEAYDAAYWKERGRVRFFRYVHNDSAAIRASSNTTPRLTPAALEKTSVLQPPDPQETDGDNAEASSAQLQQDRWDDQAPRVQTIESARPTSEEVSKALFHTLSQTGETLRGQNVFKLSRPLIIVRRLEVEKVKIKENQGWAEVRIVEAASLAAGQPSLKKRQEKQRWLLRRRDAHTWEVMLPSTNIFLNQDGAVQVLSHQLASMAEAADVASNNVRQKAQLAQLLSTVLEVGD